MHIARFGFITLGMPAEAIIQNLEANNPDECLHILEEEVGAEPGSIIW